MTIATHLAEIAAALGADPDDIRAHRRTHASARRVAAIALDLAGYRAREIAALLGCEARSVRGLRVLATAREVARGTRLGSTMTAPGALTEAIRALREWGATEAARRLGLPAATVREWGVRCEVPAEWVARVRALRPAYARVVAEREARRGVGEIDGAIPWPELRLEDAIYASCGGHR